MTIVTLGFRTYAYWGAFFSTGLDRSWDGSGHVALLQIYDRSIFPDTFGWTNAYFSGMPFPNFYPPLWYWVISALHHIGAPLLLTYKLVVLGSMLLIPLALARLSFAISNSSMTSAITAFVSLIPLLEKDMMPRYAAGLTFISTFNEGIYSEPLGFVFLVLTTTACLKISDRRGALRTALLLSGTLLCNAFTLVSALPLLAASFAFPTDKRKMRALHLLLALTVTLCITAFWTVPAITHYKYFVTVPVRPPLNDVISTAQWGWFMIGICSSAWTFLRASERLKVYLLGLLFLLIGCICGYAPGLEGLPLQEPRLITTLSVLLTIPIACAITPIGRVLLNSTRIYFNTKRSLAIAVISASIIFAGILPLCHLDSGIRAQGNSGDVSALLGFAKLHNDGRYMVQTPHLHRDRFDARALSAYLGSQSNEVATVVFRESALSSIFFVPLENKISSLQHAFGISSSLDNDPAYLNQDSAATYSQLQELGIRYVMRLKKEAWKRSVSGAVVFTSDRWEIIELPLPPAPQMERLSVPPALLFSDISYKRRRSGQVDANRIFEEQFRTGNFSPRIALSSARVIDDIDNLKDFAALILNKFDVRDQDAAFALVKQFGQTRPVILIPDASSTCKRFLAHKAELPYAVVLAATGDEGNWLDESDVARLHRDHVTELWDQIAKVLSAQLSTSSNPHSATVNLSSNETSMVLLRQSFDPSWLGQNRSSAYLAGPSEFLLLSTKALPLSFARSATERFAATLSAVSLIVSLLVPLTKWKLGDLVRSNSSGTLRSI